MAESRPSQQGWLSTRGVLFAAVLLLVMFIFSIAAAILWLPEQSPAWMNASNYGVGIWGLLISIIGFGLTLWQLHITKQAAQAASEAADSARIRLNAFSALRECEAGKRQLDLINEAIQTERWTEIVGLAQPLASSLISLSGSNTSLDTEVVKAIETAMTDLDRNCEIIERAISIDPTKLSKAKQSSAFRKINYALTLVYFNIERLS